jgi:hypothetical protein
MSVEPQPCGRGSHIATSRARKFGQLRRLMVLTEGPLADLNPERFVLGSVLPDGRGSAKIFVCEHYAGLKAGE